MIRELAHCDAARYAEVSSWPLGEALLALEGLMRPRAQERYDLAMATWSGKGTAPKKPRILEVG